MEWLPIVLIVLSGLASIALVASLVISLLIHAQIYKRALKISALSLALIVLVMFVLSKAYVA